MATTTANKEYSFDQVFHGKSLEDWVQLAHKELSRASHWRYFPLKRGQFGFDNMVMSVGLALNNMCEIPQGEGEIPTAEEVADWIHEGWSQNYRYWLKRQPWLANPNLYKKPSKALGDKRRTECAKASYQELPKDEQDKDLVIARFLIHSVFPETKPKFKPLIPTGCLLDDD